MRRARGRRMEWEGTARPQAAETRGRACRRPLRPLCCQAHPLHPHTRTLLMADKKIRVAIIGLGFGAEFIPIYQAHPNAEMYAICRRNKAELDKAGDRSGIKTRYTDYNELLKDPNIDAVHINSPIPDH